MPVIGGRIGRLSVRRHHEELIAVPSILPALWLLMPFAGALWARITTTQKKAPNRRTHPKDGGDL